MRLFQLTSATRPSLLDLALPDDQVLLRQDATYLLLSNAIWPCQVLVLEQDLLARGISCPSDVRIVTDSDWVELTLTTSQVIACLN